MNNATLQGFRMMAETLQPLPVRQIARNTVETWYGPMWVCRISRELSSKPAAHLSMSGSMPSAIRFPLPRPAGLATRRHVASTIRRSARRAVLSYGQGVAVRVNDLGR